MPNDEKNEVEIQLSISKKLDAIEERLSKLENPVEKSDSEAPPDPKIVGAEAIIRHVLSNSFPKEKLDSWNLEQLSMAYEIKANFVPKTDSSPPLPPPPQAADKVKDPTDDGFKYARHAGRNDKGQYARGLTN